MEVPIEVIGTILNSQHAGHQVRVSDDSENTGGFLIFEWWQNSDGPDAGNAFDSWIENKADLEGFFWKLVGWFSGQGSFAIEFATSSNDV